jgi:hypothetical protein
MPLITVVVLNWNRADMLADCLKSLFSQSRLPDRIIVVDNGSTDGSVERVRRQFSGIDVIDLPYNMGFCKANNIALKTVETEYVALLNNDAMAHPQWLEKLIHAMTDYPEAGSAASKMLYADHPELIDRAGDGYSMAGAGILRGRRQSADRFDSMEWIFGACAGAAIYRMDMLHEIGLFDEDFFLLYEDVDLSFRAQLRGYPCLYVPKARVYHWASSSIGHDSHTSIYYGHRNLEWVYLKNMPKALFVKTWHHHLRYNCLSGIYFGFRGLGRPFIHAKRDAVLGFPRMMKKRRQIQTMRKAGSPEIRKLLSPERLMDRLTIRKKRANNG